VDHAKPFLTAQWRHLALLNFEIPTEALEPLAPPGTMVDTYKGKAYVSVVGMLFEDTRVKGVPIPFHRNFEEVNLRFYVRRFTGEEWRRGVVFVKEIVASVAIATTARLAYNENYVVMEMGHRIEKLASDGRPSALYRWRFHEKWSHLQVIGDGEPYLPAAGSLEEFVTDHHWGYTRQRDGRCIEYRVEHAVWPVRKARDYAFDCDVAGIYGEAFMPALSGRPASAFLIEGSPVTVYAGCVCDV
jgi:uncharacterized protein YqjF (DUF2071 family)